MNRKESLNGDLSTDRITLPDERDVQQG